MFLSPADLVTLTGYVQPAAQRGWLERNNIRYTVHPLNGRPNVLVSEVATPRDASTRSLPTPLPPVDESLMAHSLDEIRASKVKYRRGLPVPECGIYFLFGGDALLYIGLSNTMNWRLHAHFMKRVDDTDNAIWFDSVATIAVPEPCLRRVEKHYIRRERPPRNIKDNGDE